MLGRVNIESHVSAHYSHYFTYCYFCLDVLIFCLFKTWRKFHNCSIENHHFSFCLFICFCKYIYSSFIEYNSSFIKKSYFEGLLFQHYHDFMVTSLKFAFCPITFLSYFIYLSVQVLLYTMVVLLKNHIYLQDLPFYRYHDPFLK